MNIMFDDYYECIDIMGNTISIHPLSDNHIQIFTSNPKIEKIILATCSMTNRMYHRNAPHIQEQINLFNKS